MKKQKKLDCSHSEDIEDDQKEDVSTDVSLGKVTVRSRKKKKSAYKPMTMIIDVSDHELSNDITLVEKGALQKSPKSANKLASLAPLNYKTNCSNYSINVSSDEYEQPIERLNTISKQNYKRNMSNDDKINEPKKVVHNVSINVDSESSLSEPNEESKKLNSIVIDESVDISVEETSIFKSKKAQLNLSTHKGTNHITSDNTQNEKHKSKTKRYSLESGENKDRKIKKLKKADNLDLSVHSVSLLQEPPNVCTERARSAQIVLDVELNQSYLIKPNQSPYKKKKQQIKEGNDSYVEEKNNDSRCSEDMHSKSRMKHKPKKSNQEKEVSLLWKSIDDSSKIDNVYYYENVVVDDSDSVDLGSFDQTKIKRSEFEQNVEDYKAASEAGSCKNIQIQKPLVTEKQNVVEIKEVIHDTINDKRKKEETKKAVIKHKVKKLSNLKTKNKKKLKLSKKAKLDEFEVLKAQLIKEALEKKRMESKKALSINKNGSTCKEGSSKSVLQTIPSDYLAVKQPKKNQSKQQSNEIHDMAKKLLSKALKKGQSPKKARPAEITNISPTINSEIAPISSQKLPGLVNNLSCIQFTSKNDLHSIPLDNRKAMKGKEETKGKKSKKKKPNTLREEMFFSDTQSSTVKSKNKHNKKNEIDNIDNLINEGVFSTNIVDSPSKKSTHTNHQTVTKIINTTKDCADLIPSNLLVVSKPAKKKRKHGEKKEKEIEVNSTDEGLPLTNKKKKKKHKDEDCFDAIAAKLLADKLTVTKSAR